MYRFLAEAKRLWELQTAVSQLTTIQAAILLNLLVNYCGLDRIGKTYGTKAFELTRKLGLFDMAKAPGNERTKKGMVFTAWAVYNWDT